MESRAPVKRVGLVTFRALAARHLKQARVPLASLLFGGGKERLGDPTMTMLGGDDEGSDADEAAPLGQQGYPMERD